MDRRSFLKTTTGGVAAAYAALNWRAPERPPEYGPLEIDLTPFHPEPGQEPYWWAECKIDGTCHRLESFDVPHYDIIEDIDVDGTRLFRQDLREPTRMMLWGERGRQRQMYDLIESARSVSFVVRLPGEKGPALPKFEFDGRIISLHHDADFAVFPRMEISVEMIS